MCSNPLARVPSRTYRTRRPLALLFTVVCAAVLGAVGLGLPSPAQAQSIAEATEGMEEHEGFLTIHWDDAEGRLLMEVPEDGPRFLYLVSQATGVGSEELGLDRGEIGPEYLARFERVGPRVYLTLENPRFRADANPDRHLRRSVEESFPTSRVGGFEILAEGDGSVLVDATDLFLRDAMNVGHTLERAGEGGWRVAEDLSSIHLPRTRAFPRNTEVEASLTLVGDEPGPEVRAHTPDGRRLTHRQHHSFVALPGEGYEPRRFDPRIGVYPVRFYDYGKSLEEGYESRYVVRHRLRKANPSAEVSEPVEPIVYYMDPGIPEPYRSAFKEGGEWWNEVLEAAGFRHAFRIEDMPADMDPLDARYNVIQWVHRTEAGSSIGPSFVDPRTGEIIKAAVRMDSHRSLADFDLYMGTAPARRAAAGADALGRCRAGAGFGPGLDWAASLDPDVTAEEFAMARRRQHSAHEIGHTLGLAHNFIAASYGRASVMDYPAPLVRIREGRLDLDDAYRPGPGLYDSLAVRYAYTPFPEGEEEAGLEAIAQEAMEKGARFVTNPHEGGWSSHPEASTWINGADVLDELARVTRVRRFLLERFDEEAVRTHEPLWTLRRRLAPVYLHHRYTLRAAVKAVGGMEFRYAMPGDPLPPTEIVSPDRQRRALDLLARALDPAELAIPERVLRLLAPTPFGHRAGSRGFEGRTDPAFDQVEAARTLAEMVVGGVLSAPRASRVVALHDRDPDLPALTEVVERLIAATWDREASGLRPALGRAAERVVVDELMELASSERAAPQARAAAEWGLGRVSRRLPEANRAAADGADPEEVAHREAVAADIARFLSRDFDERVRPGPLAPPRGTPIGYPR